MMESFPKYSKLKNAVLVCSGQGTGVGTINAVGSRSVSINLKGVLAH